MIADREPDYESDTMRMWKTPIGDKINEKALDENPKINIGGAEISLLGFSTAISKKTQKPIFYYKIKHTQPNNMFLYYFVEDNASEEDVERFASLVRCVKNILKWDMQDIRIHFFELKKMEMAEKAKEKETETGVA